MKTSWTHIEHKRRPSTWMRAAACGLDLSLSPTNYFGDRLGLETIVESRNIRH